jgi:large subunit ribosomal protein L21
LKPVTGAPDTAASCGARRLACLERLPGAGPEDGDSVNERSDMYAVIKTGGKQYKVAAGENIKVEQIAADVGQEVVLDQVLAVGSGTDLKVGTPWVSGASVKATVVAQGRHDKVRIFKMRRRKHYQKHGGHRQAYTELQISSVDA